MRARRWHDRGRYICVRRPAVEPLLVRLIKALLIPVANDEQHPANRDHDRVEGENGRQQEVSVHLPERACGRRYRLSGRLAIWDGVSSSW
jgi:hypothetical protein